MSKTGTWISNLFNGISKKIGDAIQDKETSENTSVEEKQVQVTETVAPQQEIPQQEKSQQPRQSQSQEEEPQEQPQEEKTQVQVTETAVPQQEIPQQEKSQQPRQSQSQEEEPQEQPHGEKPQERPMKTLDNKELLLRRVITTLSEKIEYAADINGKKLVIWLDCDDELEFLSYNTDSYRQQMLSTLVNERGFGFEQVMFKMGKPTAELHATKVKDNDFEYLQLVEKEIVQEHKTACKAEISIYGDAGSLKKEKYILSPEDMKEKMIAAYNIGVGQFPKGVGCRENHIAIDDDPESPMREKNKFVSRTHGHIGFSEKFGFYFQVEMNGTRFVGNRTRIFRDGEEIKCDNPQAKIPLQNGDIIELGIDRNVLLRYIQCN